MTDIINESDYEDYDQNYLYHYSTFYGGNSSEYIIPKTGKIDITSHSMGSGIYGLSNNYITRNPPDLEDGASEYIFKWDLPFIIMNQEECDIYSSSSMNLSRNMEKLKKLANKEDNLVITLENMIPIAKQFIQDIKQDFDLNMTAEALLNFWNDYNTRNDFVEMPINYILKAEGNDGVLSHTSTTCHSWSKGNVKFLENYPTYKKGDIQPVNNILTRDGFQKQQFCLGYKYDGEDWVYPSKKELRNARDIFCPKCLEKGKDSSHPIWKCPIRQQI